VQELEWVQQVHVVQEDAELQLMAFSFLGPGVEWLNGPSHVCHHLLPSRPKHSPSPPDIAMSLPPVAI
jgi:hypothetical protein